MEAGLLVPPNLDRCSVWRFDSKHQLAKGGLFIEAFQYLVATTRWKVPVREEA